MTLILAAVERGEPRAVEELLALIYSELRRLAAQKLAAEKPGQTLSATALVHEAYLRLVGNDGAECRWESRGHLFAAAAEAMRRILVDNARRKRAVRHGGAMQRVELDEALIAIEPPCNDVIELDEALGKFAEEDALKAEVVKLRFFAGLSIDETAAALGISRATAVRHWTYARAWLRVEIGEKNS